MHELMIKRQSANQVFRKPLVTRGRLHVSTAEGGHDLGPGQVLTIGPGVVHSVRAGEASEMLLTVCLTEPAGSSRADRRGTAR